VASTSHTPRLSHDTPALHGRTRALNTAGGQSFDDPGKFVSVYARQPDGGLLLTVTCFNRDAPPPTV